MPDTPPGPQGATILSSGVLVCTHLPPGSHGGCEGHPTAGWLSPSPPLLAGLLLLQSHLLRDSLLGWPLLTLLALLWTPTCRLALPYAALQAGQAAGAALHGRAGGL